jgi:hypothetical protein
VGVGLWAFPTPCQAVHYGGGLKTGADPATRATISWLSLDPPTKLASEPKPRASPQLTSQIAAKLPKAAGVLVTAGDEGAAYCFKGTKSEHSGFAPVFKVGPCAALKAGRTRGCGCATCRRGRAGPARRGRGPHGHVHRLHLSEGRALAGNSAWWRCPSAAVRTLKLCWAGVNTLLAGCHVPLVPYLSILSVGAAQGKRAAGLAPPTTAAPLRRSHPRPPI